MIRKRTEPQVSGVEGVVVAALVFGLVTAGATVAGYGLHRLFAGLELM